MRLSSFLRAATLVVLVVGFAGCKGCRDGDGGVTTEDGPFGVKSVAFEAPTGAAAFVPVLDGPLRVLAATPSGSMVAMGPGQGIAVTFTRPVVALGTESAPPENAIRLTPAIPGTLRWEGTQTLVFDPARPLPPGTAFTATLRAAGIAATDEGDGATALARDTSWTFETPRPTLVASEPTEGFSFAGPTDPLRLDFNQPVSASDIDGFIRLESRTGRAYDQTVAQSGDSAVVVRHGAFALGDSVRIVLREGLPGRGGPLGSAEERRVAFRVRPAAAFEGVAQRRGYEDDLKAPGPFDPERGITLRFATPVRFGAVRQALRLSPAAAFPPGAEAGDATEGTEHTVRLDLSPEASYTLALAALKDVYGQTVPAATATFRTTALAPSVRVPDGVMVVEAGPQAAIPVRATNIEALTVAAERLTAATLVPRLLAYDETHYYAERGEDAAKPRTPRRRVATGIARNRPGKVALRFDSLLTAAPTRAGGARTGLVAFAVQTPASGPGEEPGVTSGVAQITRLGITAKHSVVAGMVLVTDIVSAEPVAGARVEIRGLDNRVRWTGATGRDGSVETPGTDALGLTSENDWQRPVQVVIVEKDGDLAFTSNLYEDGLEPWRFDINVDWAPLPVTYAGTLFTDRGLYRSGERVELKGWVRRRAGGDWSVSRDSVRVLVEDARERVVLDRRLQLSETGGFDLGLDLGSDAAQGAYSIRLVRAADTAAVRDRWRRGGTLASGSFRVESFRAATFRVDARPEADAYVAGDRVEAIVEGRYLFGATLGGAPARVDLRLSPESFAPPGYDGWAFGALPFDYETDEGDDPSYGLYQTLAGTDATLDADGTYRLSHVLAPSTTGIPTRLTLSATVTDPSRQTQSDETSVIVHPGLFYVGLRPRAAYLDLSKDKALELDLVTVDPGGAPTSGRVTVELLREEWISAREVGADGRLRWRSERRRTPAGQQAMTIARGSLARVSMPVTLGGTYLVRATGTDVRGNVVRSETYIVAAGEGYSAWQRRDDDRLDLTPDRTTPYVPGETAKLLVASPFESALALVTVEREGVISRRMVTLTGSAPQVEIPVTEEMLPNAFVSVMLLTGRAAAPTATADVGAPGFRIGYANLRVDAEARHLRVEVEPSVGEIRPGEEIEVTLRVVDRDGRGVAGEVAFSAADAGVVDLIGYRLPDPYGDFYGPRALGVVTSESRSVLVEQRAFGQKEEDAGGGGGDRDALLRKDFRPLAFWAPRLKTDGSGRASVRFRVPERLTTLRLMASVATTDHRFGAGDGETIVTQPLVLTPALPRFARAGDAFDAGVLVTNRGGADGEATVSAAAVGLALSGGTSQRVPVPRGETREVRFRFTAPAGATAPGSARVTFRASLGGETDALETTLPLALAASRVVAASFHRVDDATAIGLRIPDDVISSALTARLAPTVLAGAAPLARSLATYPYGCLEQQTSAVRPLFLGRDLFAATDAAALGDDKARVAAWASALGSFWTGEGFSMWPSSSGGAYVQPFVSAYVVRALAEAKAAGYDVPAALTAESVAWLDGYVRRASDRPAWMPETAWHDSRALMLDALARHGRVLDAEIQALAARPLSAEGEAMLLRAATSAGNRPALAATVAALTRRLTDRLRLDGTAAYLSADPASAMAFASDRRATALGLAALVPVVAPEQAQILAGLVRTLVGGAGESADGMAAGEQVSTQEAAAILDGLAAYARRFERETPRLTASVRAAGRDVVRASFQSRTFASTVGTLRGLAPNVRTVDVARSGSGALYVALTLDALVRITRTPLDAGLALARTVEVMDGTGTARPAPVDGSGRITVAAGALVRVTLRLTSPTERAYVVVDDALPAGLEALNGALSTTDGAALDAAGAGQDRYWGSFNHTELRDDRVLLFADRLDAGQHTYVYLARATTPGTYALPAASAEMMYRPEIRARTAGGAFVVRQP